MSESSLEIEKYKLKEKDIIDIGHTSSIPQISMFPSKNYVSVSYDKSIIIFDENSKVIQKIENAHEKEITYVCIKDDDNFATCGNDKSIKFWKKEGNEFKFNKQISNVMKKEFIKYYLIQMETYILVQQTILLKSGNYQMIITTQMQQL